MTDVPATRIERRSQAHLEASPAPARAGSRGAADTVLQLDEFRAELACGTPAVRASDELVGPYEEGFAAWARGIGLGDNPYPGDSCAHLHWANGWSQARDEAQRQAR
jgi:hypothetical protein